MKTISFCEFCRCSHEIGSRHIYTKSHVLIIKDIRKKMRDKIKVLSSLYNESSPTDLFVEITKASERDINETMWCYMCSEEVIRHQVDEAGILSRNLTGYLHMSCESHAEAVDKFLSENRLLKTESTENFIIPKSMAVTKYEAIKLRKVDFIAKLNRTLDEDAKALRLKSSSSPEDAKLKLPIKSETLLVGSMPTTSTTDLQIGPSLEDFQSHVARVKEHKHQAYLEKRGYKHITQEGSTQKDKDLHQKLPTSVEAGCSLPPQIQPYKRRRKDT